MAIQTSTQVRGGSRNITEWVERQPPRGLTYYYRPQRSWAKVMFLQASVILSTGGGSASVHAGIPPPPPPRPETVTRHNPPTPLPPGADTPHPREAVQHTVNEQVRYASHWNAFLFGIIFAENCMEMKQIGLGRATHPPPPPILPLVTDKMGCV